MQHKNRLKKSSAKMLIKDANRTHIIHGYTYYSLFLWEVLWELELTLRHQNPCCAPNRCIIYQFRWHGLFCPVCLWLPVCTVKKVLRSGFLELTTIRLQPEDDDTGPFDSILVITNSLNSSPSFAIKNEVYNCCSTNGTKHEGQDISPEKRPVLVSNNGKQS